MQSTVKHRKREVWMLLPAKNRKKLERLIILSEKTHRQLAAETGWKAHSMLSQLVHGQRNTISTEAAVRLCVALRCDVSDLFLPQVIKQTQQSDERASTRGRAA